PAANTTPAQPREIIPLLPCGHFKVNLLTLLNSSTNKDTDDQNYTLLLAQAAKVLNLNTIWRSKTVFICKPVK
ncbi:hypothetical protein A2U01_0049556, partial [Trifolium medium]|nr:hypothetical protein [Trifolium medium]